MSGKLDILREITESSRTAGAVSGGRGRYARTPNYAAPAHGSSRPSSDRGRSFHFSHRTKSKSTDVSDGNRSETSSGAHQGYIERPSATEESTDAIRSLLARNTAPGAGGESAAANLADGFAYPERAQDPARISFGTLGRSKAERKEFWHRVESAEPRRSRVQGRIIGELPAELDARGRASIAAVFAQSFEERGLPYWASVHAPTTNNDSRNYHLHITYFDRPAGRDSAGEWDFAIRRKKKKRNRHTVTTRPFVNNKHPDTRAIDWPKILRRSYADACNYQLALSGHAKRHDPRSYRDSGIAKEPTEHLGHKLATLETFGLDTPPGRRNAQREIRWRIAQAEAPWMRRARRLQPGPSPDGGAAWEASAAPGTAAPGAADAPQSDGAKPPAPDTAPDPATTVAEPGAPPATADPQLFALASDGITIARRAASHAITSELLTNRLARRRSFIDTETRRLSQKDDLASTAHTATAIVALRSEESVLAARAERVAEIAGECEAESARLAAQNDRLMARFDARAGIARTPGFFDTPESETLLPIGHLLPGTDSGRTAPTDSAAQPPETQMPTRPPAFESIFQPGTDDMESLETLLGDIFKRRDSAAPDAAAEPGTPPAEAPRAAGEGPVGDPISDLVARIARGEDLSGTEAGARPQTRDDFPGSWPVPYPEDAADIDTLDAKLRHIDNRSLRQFAIANRDATDLASPGPLREEFNRGWVVFRFEAERRGVDLDTGRHDPDAARDPERARLFEDQEPCPIHTVRKNIARERVRG